MKIRTSLREALNDPRLLGKALEGDSWSTWRTLLLASMGEPLSNDELAVFRAVTGRAQAPTEPCEELVAVIGRRGGKSRAVAVLAAYLATLIDYKDVLVAGERGLLLCVAPDVKQAGIVHGYIAGILSESELLRPLLDSATASTLRLSSGIDIEVRAASFRRLRGVTCIAAIADESCFWFSDESSANRDEEILQAIAAAAEYGGEWRSDIAAFISRDAVTACIDYGVHERPYRSGVRYVAFCDPSGGSNDSMTLAISHLEDGQRRLDLVREVRPPFSPESAVGEFCETLAAYRIKRVQGDRYAGQWPAEQFRKRGVRYEPADKTSSQLFLELLPEINAGTCRLLDHRRTIEQLINLERRTSFGTGRDTIGHPPGLHDDLAVAVAGAVTLAATRRPQMRVGTYNPMGGDGRIHWKDEEPKTRVRVQWYSPEEARELKEKGQW